MHKKAPWTALAVRGAGTNYQVTTFTLGSASINCTGWFDCSPVPGPGIKIKSLAPEVTIEITRLTPLSVFTLNTSGWPGVTRTKMALTGNAPNVVISISSKRSRKNKNTPYKNYHKTYLETILASRLNPSFTAAKTLKQKETAPLPLSNKSGTGSQKNQEVVGW
jgi:hypothetical protein